jgi:signal peptidase
MKLTLLAAVPLLVGSLTVMLAEMPELAGADGTYAVLSDSMEPYLGKGDLVLVEEVEPSRIQEGDVVVFTAEDAENSALISHRVVDRRDTLNGYEFLTRGDNLEQDDGWKSEDRIVGKVTSAIVLGGAFRNFVYSTAGFLALIALPTLLILLDQLHEIATSVDKKFVEEMRV